MSFFDLDTLDPRIEYAQVRARANQFNTEQALKDRILARILRDISTARHQGESDLLAGLYRARRIVEEA